MTQPAVKLGVTLKAHKESQTLTDVPDLLCHISSDVREIPHGQETVKTRPLLRFLDTQKTPP